jgi:hypothetical protein
MEGGKPMTDNQPDVKREKRVAAGRKAWRSGDSFENSIEAECRGYQMQGTALVQRFRLTGRFAKGKGFVPGQSPVDFVGSILVDDHFCPVAFDAKSFADDRWDFSEWRATAKKRHQLKALRDMAAFGGLAFALVRQNRLMPTPDTGPDYYNYPAWLVPLSVIEEAAKLDHWSLSADDLDHLARKIRGANWLEAAIATRP